MHDSNRVNLEGCFYEHQHIVYVDHSSLVGVVDVSFFDQLLTFGTQCSGVSCCRLHLLLFRTLVVNVGYIMFESLTILGKVRDLGLCFM